MTQIKRYAGWLLGIAAIVVCFAVLGAVNSFARADYASKNMKGYIITVPTVDWRDCKAGCVMMKASIWSSFDVA